MVIKAKIKFPKLEVKQMTIEVTVKDGMSKDEIIDWLYKNRKKIIKDNGCDLDDDEIVKAIAKGQVQINPMI